jgi:hypothetical protein
MRLQTGSKRNQWQITHLMLRLGVKPFSLKMKKISWYPVIGAKTGLEKQSTVE